MSKGIWRGGRATRCTGDNKSSYNRGNIQLAFEDSGGDDIGLISYISLYTKPVEGSQKYGSK